jgi:hypothetical protein
MTGECVIRFAAEHFKRVERMAGARRKRKLSEAHKEKLAKSNIGYRFKKKVDGSNGAKTPQG